MAQGITTDISLQKAFTEVMDPKPAEMVAVSPSELLNGGKAPATVENWKKLGFS